MMRNKLALSAAVFAIVCFHSCLFAQSGGAFVIEKSVIAAGDAGSGGPFFVTGTTGQPNAGGDLDGTPFSNYSGFWTSDFLAPTAAHVSISGRVFKANGTGVRNVTIALTDAGGLVRVAITNGFGYYRFDDIAVGAAYVLSASSRLYAFVTPTRIISVNDYVEDANFTVLQ